MHATLISRRSDVEMRMQECLSFSPCRIGDQAWSGVAGQTAVSWSGDSQHLLQSHLEAGKERQQSRFFFNFWSGGINTKLRAGRDVTKQPRQWTKDRNRTVCLQHVKTKCWGSANVFTLCLFVLACILSSSAQILWDSLMCLTLTKLSCSSASWKTLGVIVLLYLQGQM